jgi:hypothetical protein
VRQAGVDHPRYRLENGQPCVDVRIAGIEQLFDNRDPAPFRERDLDPDLVEYLLDAGDDLRSERTFRLVFWLTNPCQPGEIDAAFHAHFEYELERIERSRRRQRRTGQVALLLGACVIVALLSLAQLVGRVAPGSIGAALREGLVIASWVVMWRPVEILIYDWIPVRRQRRVIRRLLAAPIDVRTGAGPDVAPPVRHAVAEAPVSRTDR